MIRSFILSLLIGAAFFCYGNEPKELEVDAGLLSEALGHMIVQHLQNPGFNFEIDRLVKGILDEKAGKTSPLSQEDYEQTLMKIQEKIFLKTAEENLQAAELFLSENSKRDGVISIDPQIQYQVLESGSGTEVTELSSPLIHYTGKLLNGTVFSSSKELNTPVTIPLNQAIPGFHDGLVGMKEGEKRTLFIHPDKAYGLNGNLPPNSLLIFEVEIVKADAPLTSSIEQSKE